MKDASPLNHSPATSGGYRLWPACLFIVALGVRIPGLFVTGFPADQAQFVLWAHHSQVSGLAGIYRPKPDGGYTCNYPPGYLYLLRGLAGLQNLVTTSNDAKLTERTAGEVYRGIRTPASRWAVALHKTPAILADAITAALLLFWLRRVGRRTAIAVSLAYAVHPAVWYDSAVWGQVDAIHTLLMLLSVEAARQKRFRAMAALAALAMLTKAQAVVLLPVWSAAAWEAGRADRRKLATMAIAAVVTCVFVLWPFHGVMHAVWSVYAGAASYYPYTHLNGFSAWFLGAPLAAPKLGESLAQWYVRDDGPAFLSLSPRTWGLLGVLTLWFVTTRELVRRQSAADALRWAVRVLPLGFFVLSTQMHERYLFPAVALWAWTAEVRRGWWFGWFVISVCAAVNMMWAWPGPAVWSGTIGSWIHRPWLGVSSGSCIAGALVLLLCVTLFDDHAKRRGM